MARKALSKKLRFEVFKRDKFTCQYCGKKSPDIVLQVDHIEPVALGGTNEILNLITSCQECNAGKKAIPLDKDVVLDKQRQQLEELQERREQIEMMFEWKKALDNLGEHSAELLIEYVENNIMPYTLSDKGSNNIKALVKKFTIDEIFMAIDKGKSIYLKYDEEGKLTQDSVNTFLSKIGGIIVGGKRSPVENKIHYIKGICRNRFNYWNDQTGIIILKEYVKALRGQGWSDEKILEDLETEVSDVAKTSKHWSEWRSTMEKWTDDINGWGTKEVKQEEKTSIAADEIEMVAQATVKDVLMFFSLIRHLRTPFDAESNDLLKNYLEGVESFLREQLTALRGELKYDGDIITIEDLSPDPSTASYFKELICVTPVDSGLKFYIDDLCFWYLPHWLDTLYFPSMDIYDEEGATLFMDYYEKGLDEELSKMQKHIQKD